MRITLDLDPTLLERVKNLDQDRSLSAVVCEALAAYLDARSNRLEDPPFEVCVRGCAGARFPSDAELAAAEEDDDLAALQRSRAKSGAPT